MPLSLGRKDIVHPDEFIGIIVDTPLPLPLGSVEEFIISCLRGKGELVTFLDVLQRPPCLFFIAPEQLYFPNIT